MYSGGCFAGIVLNGATLSEDTSGIVAIPFGSEYEIELRGPGDGRRSVAKVYIDGVNVTDDGIIVPAYGALRLERPVKGSNKRFKFAHIESFAAYQAGKGGPDDGTKGVVRVEFYREKSSPKPVQIPRPQRLSRQGANFMPTGSMDVSVFEKGTSLYSAPRDMLESGVTVEGSQSSQNFVMVDIDTESHVAAIITIKLKGYSSTSATILHNNTSYCRYCSLELNPLSNNCPYCGARVR